MDNYQVQIKLRNKPVQVAMSKWESSLTKWKKGELFPDESA